MLVLVIVLVFNCLNSTKELKDYGIVSNFSLIDTEGKKFEFYQVQKPVLLYFGYTSCPDYCPMTLSKIEKFFNTINDKEKPQVILITVDPERDKPEILKQYLKNWEIPVIGLTGTRNQIEEAAKIFGIYIRVEKAKDHIHVEHTTSTFFIDKDHRLRYIFSFRDPLEKYKKIIKEYYKEIN